MGIPGIEGRTAIVTGAGRGIGRAYASALANGGARVVIADLDEVGAKDAADEITAAGGEAIGLVTDIADESSTVAMAAAAHDAFGSIDILVNNAAIWSGLPFESIDEMTTALWTKVMNVNIIGMYLTTKAVVPFMKEQERGVVVNQSSIGAYLGGPLMSAYCTSKGAVNTFTRAVAMDYGEYGIRCNAIAPGIIANEATLTTVPEEMLDMMEINQAIKRRGTQEDLVGPMLFLAGDASSFMTGQVIVVDGGMIKLG